MDERQFNYLQEMDIPLWISRETHESDMSQEMQSEVPLHAETQQLSQVVETPTIEPLAEKLQPLAEATSEPFAEIDIAKDVSLDWSGLQRVVSECQRCSELVSHRNQTVFGVGNSQADWLIIGEAPGMEEDRQGEPFVGSAGQLLNSMLLAIGLRRSQVYIANILKCHPPNNRDPHPQEIEACGGYLQRQIELIQPKMILVVGKSAAQVLLKSTESVANLRGKVHRFEYDSGMDAPLVVTYHPAYLLRAPQEKAKSWHDLKLALNSLGR